jgi:hypothetical protein
MADAYASDYMKGRKYWYYLCGWASCICFVLLLLYGRYNLLYTNGLWHSGPVGEMNHNAHIIGVAIGKYERNHDGALPSQLSELVPNYIASSNLVCFFWPPPNKTSIENYLSSGTISNKIDNEGAYAYLGARGSNINLVFYERTNLWATHRDVAKVVTLETNLTAHLPSIDDVISRLSRLP